MPTTTLQELEKFQREAEAFCGPLFFSKSVQTPLGNVTNNGSFGLVDTGAKKLLVTCAHVWQGFQQERSREPDLKMCICLDRPFRFAPNGPIGEDENLDIVTFEIDLSLGGCGGRQFCRWDRDAAATVVEGDPLLFVGFPGYLRHESAGCITFGRSPFWMKAVSVNDRKLLCDIGRLTAKTPPEQFGGMSGCPCFLVRDYKALELAGFVTDIPLNPYLSITLARCINRDGSIG